MKIFYYYLNLSFIDLLEKGNFDRTPIENYDTEFDTILMSKWDGMSLEANMKLKEKNDFVLW